MLYAKVTNPNAGYPNDKEQIKGLPSDDAYFRVTNVSMGGSHTSIVIDGYPDAFNSINFTFFRKVGTEFFKHDIFSDPYYNPYL